MKILVNVIGVIAGCHLNLRYSDMNGLFFVIDHDVDATDAGRHQRKGVKFRTFKFVLTLQLGSLLLECSWVVTGLYRCREFSTKVTFLRISH